jgi:hypothetical protein
MHLERGLYGRPNKDDDATTQIYTKPCAGRGTEGCRAHHGHKLDVGNRSASCSSSSFVVRCRDNKN